MGSIHVYLIFFFLKKEAFFGSVKVRCEKQLFTNVKSELFCFEIHCSEALETPQPGGACW